jgi:hypothetical protein
MILRQRVRHRYQGLIVLGFEAQCLGVILLFVIHLIRHIQSGNHVSRPRKGDREYREGHEMFRNGRDVMYFHNSSAVRMSRRFLTDPQSMLPGFNIYSHHPYRR